ncbi:YmaF family protein [Ruminiclostridium josui]|uniref:YmaF family protein n=1 Tax=Ruminiclostridium josui TaxID=1499 RepID=UPI0004652899|nr:YmaF family protein [Ruminiclostridium josui]
MGNTLHSHSFAGKTSNNKGHVHQYSGNTNETSDQIGHIHYIEGSTTLEDGHVHHYRIATSPAIYVYGGHYHVYMGNADFTKNHVQIIAGDTSFLKKN